METVRLVIGPSALAIKEFVEGLQFVLRLPAFSQSQQVSKHSALRAMENLAESFHVDKIEGIAIASGGGTKAVGKSE